MLHPFRMAVLHDHSLRHWTHVNGFISVYAEEMYATVHSFKSWRYQHEKDAAVPQIIPIIRRTGRLAERKPPGENALLLTG